MLIKVPPIWKYFDAKLYCCRIENFKFYFIDFSQYTSEDSSAEKNASMKRQQDVQKH